ncbi:antitoxin MazE-like protein [Segnochrobactraceae bacterium EtOH-i3]
MPDTLRSGFAEECQLQVRAVAAVDAADDDVARFLDEVLADLDDDVLRGENW